MNRSLLMLISVKSDLLATTGAHVIMQDPTELVLSSDAIKRRKSLESRRGQTAIHSSSMNLQPFASASSFASFVHSSEMDSMASSFVEMATHQPSHRTRAAS